MTYIDSPWAFKRGDLVQFDDGGKLTGVVLEVANPGIVRIRWGTDDHSGWYSSNDICKARLK